MDWNGELFMRVILVFCCLNVTISFFLYHGMTTATAMTIIIAIIVILIALLLLYSFLHKHFKLKSLFHDIRPNVTALSAEMADNFRNYQIFFCSVASTELNITGQPVAARTCSL